MNYNKSSFVRQALVLAIASLLVRFIGFLYRLPLTNLIGDQGNAIYSYGYYFYMLFLIMSSSGLPSAISKMVSERIALKQYKNAHQVFKVSLMIAACTGLLGSLALGFGAKHLANYLGSPDSYYAILVLSPTVFLVAIMAVFRGYFQGMNNAVPTAFSQVIEQIFNAILSVVLAYIFVKKSVPLGAAGGTAGTGIGAIIGLLFLVGIYLLVKPRLKKRINLDKSKTLEPKTTTAIKIFKMAFPIIVGTAIFSITNLIDMFMVNRCLTESGVFSTERIEELYGQLTGKYVVLTNLPISISTAIAAAIIPSISATLAIGDIKEVNKKINTAIKLTMIIAIPASIGIGVLGDQILLLLFPKYPAGGILLKVGAMSIIFLSLYQIITGILQGSGYVYVPVVAAAMGALIKIPANYFFISNPNLNVIGAIMGTTLCYILASSICLGFIIVKMKFPFDFLGVFIKPAIASMAMGLSCYVFYYTFYYVYPSNTISITFSIVIGITIYFIFMIILGGISKDEIELLPLGDKIYSKLNSTGFIK